MIIVIAYLAFVNITAFFLAFADKRRARSHARRISERSLLLWAAAGGSAGLYAGLLAFRHKTRKPKFMIGVPLIMLLNALIALAIARYAFNAI